jgi:hypothetical protein
MGGLMPRGMVALLAAVAAGLPVLATLAHGHLVWVMAGDAAGAAGLVAYVTAVPALRAKGSFKETLPKYGPSRLSPLRRHRRDTPRQPEFVLVTTMPAEDHRSSLREALDALGPTSVRDALNALK